MTTTNFSSKADCCAVLQLTIECYVDFSHRMSMPCLKTDDKLKFIFLRFHSDLLQIQSIYEKDKEDPCTGRNMPMFSGRIAWAKQLYQKMEQPMLLFKEHPWLFKYIFYDSIHFV